MGARFDRSDRVAYLSVIDRQNAHRFYLKRHNRRTGELKFEGIQRACDVGVLNTGPGTGLDWHVD